MPRKVEVRVDPGAVLPVWGKGLYHAIEYVFLVEKFAGRANLDILVGGQIVKRGGGLRAGDACDFMWPVAVRELSEMQGNVRTRGHVPAKVVG